MSTLSKRTLIPFKTLVAAQMKQFNALGILIILVPIGVGLLSHFNSYLFQRFLGEIHPLIAILVSCILGFLALSFLLSKGWFIIHKKFLLNRVLPYAGLILLFASIAIVIDLKIVYPADINIPFPLSLLFYPVIAFLVEIVFHLLPISLLLVATTFIFRKFAYDRLLWPCILIVALQEPTYQLIFMGSNPTWSMLAVWTNLFLFNIVQLVVFKKYGFISMYALRLLYYLIWHILWGPCA